MSDVISRDVAVAAVRRVLEARVVGRELPGFERNGRKIRRSEVASIRCPGKNPHTWLNWTVQMRVLGTNEKWSTTLAWFFEVEELEQLFESNFGDATTEEPEEAEERLALV